MATYQNILYEKRDRIAFITINRPERLNAIDEATAYELLDAWTDFKWDAETLVATLTGAGDRAFSAGADLKFLSGWKEGEELPFRKVAFGAISRHFELWKPAIAAVNGFALGGGLEMALACDIRIASERASFGLPEVTVALMPGGGGTQRLPRAIPLALAMEMLLTGEPISAQEAYRIGLVSRVVPPADLLPTAEAIARKICDNGPLAVRAAKEAAMRGLDMPLHQGLGLEQLLDELTFGSDDAREGPRAFSEKRRPQYRGR